MERFIATQTTTNETLKENIQALTSRVDSMAAHQKTMDTQIAQIAQQVSHLSRSQGQLPGQTEVNPRRQVNAISTVGAGLEESPVMVLQEVVPISASAGTERKEKNEGLSPTEETRHQPPARPYQPPVPYPQRLAWSKLHQLEPRFAQFLETLHRIYASRPFLETLKNAPAHFKFLRELLSKKGEPGVTPVTPTFGSCRTLLPRQSPSKLQDPGSFSIPCCIGDTQIERALCDLGASVSLMPLSLCQKLQLRDLKPTSMTIQLADCSIRQPVGILEDVPIQVGKFLIPCDFIVLDMDEDFPAPLIFGRPFLATAGAVIDVQAGTLSFQVCGEKVDFSFPPPAPPLAPVFPPPSAAPIPHSPFDAAPEVDIYDGHGGSPMLSASPTTCSGAVPLTSYFAPACARPGEVKDPPSYFYTSPRPPPASLPSTIWR